MPHLEDFTDAAVSQRGQHFVVADSLACLQRQIARPRLIIWICCTGIFPTMVCLFWGVYAANASAGFPPPGSALVRLGLQYVFAFFVGLPQALGARDEVV